MRKRTKIILSVIAVLLIILTIFLIRVSYYLPTLPQNTKLENIKRIQVDTNFYKANNAWILLNQDHLWEMYISGSPLERGTQIGILSQELINFQEDAFVKQIKSMIPSKFSLKFLRMFVGIFNRNLGKYIPEENKEEIYAISHYVTGDYFWIGSPYQRIMNYHAAHDIGHAVQVMGFVGCSALSTWNAKTQDSTLLVGRNFDFYVGDEFAKNKVVMFMKPDKGYPMALITWGGMTGVVSGMNNQGLAVMLNAAPTSIPTHAAEPVSMVAREILQYAKNIREAVEIAKTRHTFVSEQFIIASAKDNKSIVIEKTPDKCVVFDSGKDYLICANHFQSKELSQTVESQKTASGYRHERMEEWVKATSQFTPEKMVVFLRDTKGKEGKDIGLGNEKSINQLIAHHSIVFHPSSKTFWISTAPLQEGRYLAYNLDSVFSTPNIPTKKGVSIENLTIAADTDFISNELESFIQYKHLLTDDWTNNIDAKAQRLIVYNPNYYYTYKFIGDKYYRKNQYSDALKYYQMALGKEISTQKQKIEIDELIEKCKEKK